MRVAFLTPETDPHYGWARYGYDLAQALTAQENEIVALTQPTDQRHGDFWFDVRPVLPQLVPEQRGFRRSLAAAATVRRAVFRLRSRPCDRRNRVPCCAHGR